MRYSSTNIKERLEQKIQRTDTCWIWKGTIDPNGYGKIMVNRKLYYAHRLSYEAFKDFIPEGLTIDHLCRNKKCVNPSHLEPVTSRENTLRAIPFRDSSDIGSYWRNKTHCPQGHPYNDENTKVTSQGRQCKICNSLRKKQYRLRLKQLNRIINMNNFQIFDEEHLAPSEPTSTFHYDEGNWLYRGTGNIKVFAFEDEGESVHIWIAEKPRTAIVEVTEPAYKLGSRFGVRSYA